MSRPLTGTVTVNSSGTFTAEVPAERGSKRRRRATFPTRAAAESWRARAIQALTAGQPVPDAGVMPARPNRPNRPNRPDRPSDAGARSTCPTFSEVGERWIQERYVEDGHADVDREEQVRGQIKVIDEYLTSRRLTIETLTRDEVRVMYKALRKGSTTRQQVDLPANQQADRLVTQSEARDVLSQVGCPSSLPTFRRAIKDGRLKHAATRGAAHLYRLGDVFDPAAELASKTDRSAGRYSHSTLVDVRRTFRNVLQHARVVDGLKLQPGVRGVKLPKRPAGDLVTTRAVTLSEMARLCAHLHVVHQVVLVLVRVLGLRISEAYGLLVEDVLDFGPGAPGLLTVQSQGGRNFRLRGPDGQVMVVPHVDATKRRSKRVLVVPAALMDLLRLVIMVFHTAADGSIEAKSRLVPGLESDDASGQSRFRQVLIDAAASEGLDIQVKLGRGNEVRGRLQLTPQHMRRSFATALEATPEKIEHIRAALGQRRGNEVIHLHYIIEDPELGPQRAVAEAMAQEISRELPDGLLVPTAKSCTTANQPALAGRGPEIDALLLDAGWLINDHPDGDWMTVADAAATRGVTEAQIRADVAAGRLSSMKTTGAGSRAQYVVDAQEVFDLMERLGPGSDIRALAEELEVSYDMVRQFISRHPDLSTDVTQGRRDHRVNAHVAEAVRAHFVAQRLLEQRAYRMPEVARLLGVSVAAINTHISHGRLVEDARFHGGVRSVTKESLQALQQVSGRRTARRTALQAAPAIG